MLLPILAALGVTAAASEALDTRYEKSTRLDLVWARVADFKGEYGSVESAEFSPDGRYIVAATKFDFQVVLFRVSDGTEIWRISARDEVEHAQFSPDGKYIATGGEDASTRIYDAMTGEEVAVYLHTQSVDSLVWSPDGRLLLVGEEDYFIDDKRYGYGRVLSWPGLELVATTDNGYTHNGVAFSPDGALAASTYRDGVNIWDARNGFERLRQVETSIPGERPMPCVAVNWSADGGYMVVGCQKGHLFVFDARDDYRLLRHMAQTDAKIESVDFSPDTRYLVHGGHTPDLWVWKTADVLNPDIATVDLRPDVRAFATGNAEDLNFSSNGAWLVSAHQDGVVRLWVLLNDDPNVASEANAILMQGQAERDWGEVNRRALEAQ